MPVWIFPATGITAAFSVVAVQPPDSSFAAKFAYSAVSVLPFAAIAFWRPVRPSPPAAPAALKTSTMKSGPYFSVRYS